MEFYQVHYGGGEWEDSWKDVSDLYMTEEKANNFVSMLGFKKVTHPNGREGMVQQKESDGFDYIPHWVRIEKIKVID